MERKRKEFYNFAYFMQKKCKITDVSPLFHTFYSDFHVDLHILIQWSRQITFSVIRNNRKNFFSST